jgi:hypothetical protein
MELRLSHAIFFLTILALAALSFTFPSLELRIELGGIQGPGVIEEGLKKIQETKEQKLIYTGIVTVLVLSSSLFVIVSQKYHEADRKWAYGAVGTILGYWLSP